MNAGLFSFMLALLLSIGYFLMYTINGLLPHTTNPGSHEFRSVSIIILDLFFNELTIYFVLFIGGILSIYSRATSSSLVVSFIFTILSIAAVAFALPAIKSIIPLSIDAIYPAGLILLERVFIIYSILILLLEALSAGDIRNY